MRLWLLEQVKEIEVALHDLVSVMIERADKEKEYLMPGYTHLQVSEISYHSILVLSCVTARTTYPVVPSAPVSRDVVRIRSSTLATTGPKDLGATSRFSSSCRKSVRA